MQEDTDLNEIMLRYLDRDLSPVERQVVEERLKVDPAYQSAFDAIQQQTAFAKEQFKHLALTHKPNAQLALNRMNVRITEEKRYQMNTRMRRIAAVATVAIVLAGSLTFAPVRALASDLLAVFRVERFVVVNVDDARLDELEAAFESLDTEELVFGDKETIREAGEPTTVATIAEAEAQVGFSLRIPEGYGEPTEIAVQGGSQYAYTPNVEDMRQVYSAVGLDPEVLPSDIDGQRFEITREAGAMLMYETEDGSFMVAQAGAPTTVIPDGINTDDLAVAVLQLLGMSEAEAQAMAANIDFSTTLLLPVPTSKVERVREITVDGVTGVIFEGGWDEAEDEWSGSVLTWQNNGIVYAIAADGNLTPVEIAATLN